MEVGWGGGGEASEVLHLQKAGAEKVQAMLKEDPKKVFLSRELLGETSKFLTVGSQKHAGKHW